MSDINIYELDKTSDKACVIARIHTDAFPGFFLTRLGSTFLTILYQCYIDDLKSGVIVAECTKRKEILGFIAYSKDYPGFYSKLKKTYLLKFALCAALVALKHPSFIKRLLGAFGKEEEVKRAEKYVELASIGVSSSVQGNGIGGKLVDYLISIIDFDEYEYISLETDAFNNDVAKSFYVKKGFKLVGEYKTAEGRRMNEYQYRSALKNR